MEGSDGGAGLPLAALLCGLEAALAGPGGLADKAGWVLAVARILERRSRLLLPPTADPPQESPTMPGQSQAADRAQARALAHWLAARPQLGLEVFHRGGAPAEAAEAAAPDIIEFLWASIAVFDAAPQAAPVSYRPAPPALYSVAEARDRILDRLAESRAGLGLAAVLPPATGGALHRRSAWSSTFAAALELAKSGAVDLDQATTERPPVLRRPGEAAMAAPAHPKGGGHRPSGEAALAVFGS